MNGVKIKPTWSLILLGCFAAALPWPLPLSSAAMILFGVYALIAARFSIQLQTPDLYLVVLLLLYFLLYPLQWLLDSESPFLTGFETEKKLALFFFPALLLNRRFSLRVSDIKNIRLAYIYSVAIAAITCMIVAASHYSGREWWTYHTFSSTIGNHAVYFSFQIMIAWNWLSRMQLSQVKFYLLTALFFSTMLLLSSKLLIPVFMIMILAHFTGLARQKNQRFVISFIATGAILVSLLLGGNIIRRYNDISLNRITDVSKTHYQPSQYFDGVTLRLIQQKFALQILNHEQSWWFGTGVNHAQTLLDDQYRSSGMYTGADGHHGYSGLNFHNQYVETTVRLGLLGFLLLIVICVLLFYYSRTKGHTSLAVITLLCMIFFLTESVLETQRGLFAFLFFTLFEIKSLQAQSYDQTSI